MSQPAVHALIPAAGTGARFGGSVLKQYLSLCGKPVLSHAIEAVLRAPQVTGVTLVLSPQDHMFQELIGHVAGNLDTVGGGATRAGSVMNGLQHIRRKHPGTQWVLVHDAVRPCLPRACLSELLRLGLATEDGAILAVPVQDSLKTSDSAGFINGSVSREGLWAAQTPQLFPLERLVSALGSMLDSGEVPTDEASAMQASGARPLLVMGSPANIKITRPADMAIAESWLLQRGEGAE